MEAWTAKSEETAAAILTMVGHGALRDRPADLRRLAVETDSGELRRACCALVYAGALRRALREKDADAAAEEALRLGVVAEQLHAASFIDAAAAGAKGGAKGGRLRGVSEAEKADMQRRLDALYQRDPERFKLSNAQVKIGKELPHRRSERTVRRHTRDPRL